MPSLSRAASGATPARGDASGRDAEERSGAWGAFANLVEGSAKVFGEKAAISALEAGEDHGLKLYRDEMEKLDPTARSVIQSEVLPAQERTHHSMSTLKHSFHYPPRSGMNSRPLAEGGRLLFGWCHPSARSHSCVKFRHRDGREP